MRYDGLIFWDENSKTVGILSHPVILITTTFWKSRITTNMTKTRGSFQRYLTCWMVLVVSLATASDEIDCTDLSDYTSGQVPDTCRLEHPLNATETEIINLLRAECHDFPLKCRLRKYTLYTVNSSVKRNLIQDKQVSCLYYSVYCRINNRHRTRILYLSSVAWNPYYRGRQSVLNLLPIFAIFTKSRLRKQRVKVLYSR